MTNITAQSLGEEQKQFKALLDDINTANGKGTTALQTANGQQPVTGTQTGKPPVTPEQQKAIDAAAKLAAAEKNPEEATKTFFEKLGEQLPDDLDKLENTFWEICAKALAKARTDFAQTSGGSIRGNVEDSFYNASSILNDFKGNISTFARAGDQIKNAGTRMIQNGTRAERNLTNDKKKAITEDAPGNPAIDKFLASHKDSKGKIVPIKLKVDGEDITIGSSADFQRMITEKPELKGKIIKALDDHSAALTKDMALFAVQTDDPQGAGNMIDRYLRDYGVSSITLEVPKGSGTKIEIHNSVEFQNKMNAKDKTFANAINSSNYSVSPPQ